MAILFELSLSPFNWLASAGTLMLIAGLLTMVAIGLPPVRALRVAGETFRQLRWTVLTVVAVLALAYVVNQSGQTITLGLLAAGVGSFFAFLSPLIGWLGVAVTGSDTASNALFGGVQVAAAHDTGISPVLLAAGNSSGGVFGKMSSAQHLAIGAAAVGLAGQEGVLFRKVVVLEHRHDALHVRARLSAIDAGTGLDGRQVTMHGTAKGLNPSHSGLRRCVGR